MTPRNRLILIFLVALTVAGAGFGYTISRLWVWHERGWAGLYYYPEEQETRTARGRQAQQRFGLSPGEVAMTFGGTRADALFRARDRVVSVNGIPIKDIVALRKLDAKLVTGDGVTYRIVRNGRTLDVPIRMQSPLRCGFVIIRTLTAFIVAAVFVIVALLVAWRRPDDQRALVFFAFALVAALATLGPAATLYESSGGRGIVPAFGIDSLSPILFFVATIAYAPLILHFALIFPRKRPVVQNRPNLIRWIYAGALLSALLFLVVALLILVFLKDPATVGRGAYSAGYVVGKYSKWASMAGLLLALHIIWAGRREGVIHAFRRRPFRSVFAVFATFVGVSLVISNFGSAKLGMLVFAAGMIVPALLMCSYPVLAAVSLMRSYRAAGVEEKRQVQWPLWGLIITLAAKILSFMVGLGISVYMGWAKVPLMEFRTVFQVFDILPALASLLIPISFAFAILKYRLMNIDIIIRKTVVYAVLSGTIVVMYVILVGGLGTLLVSAAGVQNQTLVITSTLVVALMFVPVRNKLQTVVDRYLFRHKYDYPEALRAVSAETRAASETGEYLAAIAEKLQQALQNRAVVLFIERQDEYVATGKVGVSDTLLGRLRVPHTFVEFLDRPFDPRKRGLPDAVAAPLARVDTALVVPFGRRGFIAAAPKLSGGEIDVEDIDFLRSAAEQIAMGTDRIRMQVEEADYAQARAIQQTLLPREMPRVTNLDLSGIWQPARTMGGDYYDLIQLGDRELAVCIGDVAGKGMPAALLMSGLQAAVRSSASSSPRDLCERVRRVVVSSLSGGRFVTFFYATVDTAAMRLRYCNAGHNAPILSRADGSVVRLPDGGPAFSRLFRDEAYQERELSLLPGDRLVLFTDGVSEAGAPSSDLFGEQRIEELVRTSDGMCAEEIQKSIVEAATAYSGGDLEDDLTLVVVRVTG
jgi:serine phosphatase RsbU (regulator of sigma subunit)